MTSLPNKVSVKFIVDVTYKMLNPNRDSSNDEVIIRAGTAGWLYDEPYPAGQLETLVRSVDSAWSVRDFWVDSAWFVIPQPPKRTWYVELLILFGDEEAGMYQRVHDTVEAAFRHEAIDIVVTNYENEQRAALSGSADLPSVINWIEISVHERF